MAMSDPDVIRSMMMLLVALALAAADAPGRDLQREIAALRPRDVSAQEKAVLDNLEGRASRALAAIPRARDRREADRARPELRRRLLDSLGIARLPWPPDLRPRHAGTIPRAGYRVEKIVYRTLPDMQVPAHLYVPDGVTRPSPAVLFYPGHWWADSKSRPDFQAFCINMARLGFVVLSFDPFGQGERGVSSRDHRRTEALLVGVAQQGIAEHETRCALEYLRSRREVDPRRIGITGASGGGYNTWITAALDDRIAAAVPVVGTSDFAEQIRVCRPLDWYQASEHCHFVPGLIRYANNHELLAMAAPRPVLIIAARQDQSFPIDGVRAVADYGRALYDSYGDGGRIGLMVDDSEGHGYQRKKREAAYGWFLRWLMGRGDGAPFPEPPTETPAFDAPELRCFPAGDNQPAGPAIIAMVRRLARDLPPASPRLEFESVLGPWPERPPGPPRVRPVRLQRLTIPTEPGLEVPAFLLRPAGEPRGVVVAVDDRGKESLASDPVVAEAFESGWAVCGIDPRGIGELATAKSGWVFAVSLLLGENLVGRQAADVTRVMDALGAADAFPGKPVGLYARGPDASLMAMYAIAREARDRPGASRLNWYILRDGFLSYRAFFERPRALRASFRLMPADGHRTTAFDREIPASFFAFDVLRSWDLPQLLDLGRVDGAIVNPIDGDGDRISEDEARKLLPRRVRAISAPEPDPAVRRFLGERFVGRGRVRTGVFHHGTTEPGRGRRDSSRRGVRATIGAPLGVEGSIDPPGETAGDLAPTLRETDGGERRPAAVVTAPVLVGL
jgi:dienelactone hydrolase